MFILKKPRDNNSVGLVKITSMINFQQSGCYMEAEIADFSLKTEEKNICIDIRQKAVCINCSRCEFYTWYG